MKRHLVIATLGMLALAACQQSEEFHGLWQESVCQSNPCPPKAKMHLGQYGDAVAGVIAWVRSQQDIDTFNSPSFECGCDYIQAGSIRGNRLRLTTYSVTDCTTRSLCNPCGCDDYDLEATLNDDDRLIGNVVCKDGTQHSVEFVKALGTPKSGCELSDE